MTSKSTTTTPSVVAELRGLRQLADQGVLSRSEFSAAKAAVLVLSPVRSHRSPRGGRADAAGAGARGAGGDVDDDQK